MKKEKMNKKRFFQEKKLNFDLMEGVIAPKSNQLASPDTREGTNNETHDVEILSEDEKHIEFIIRDINLPYSKTLRDIMYNKIPTMAINESRTIKNTSSLPFELLSERVSLVPIKAEALEFEYYDGGEYKANNSIVFKLNKRGYSPWEIASIYQDRQFPTPLPSANLNNLVTNVLSGDLQWIPLEGQQKLIQSGSQQEEPVSIRPTNENFVLFQLKEGQEVEMEFIGVKGIGQIHTRFSPVSMVIVEEIENSMPSVPQISTFQSPGSASSSIQPFLPPSSSSIQSPSEIQPIGLYPELVRKAQDESLTINDMKVLFPKKDYKIYVGLKGQISGRKLIQQALTLTDKTMDIPYRIRKKDIGIPGYYY